MDRIRATARDDVEHAVAVDVDGLDRPDFEVHGNLDPLEPPVLGKLVRPSRRFGLTGNRVRPLAEELDPALVVVDDEEILETVGVEVGRQERAGVRTDRDHFEGVEAEVGGGVGILCHRGDGNRRRREEREGGDPGRKGRGSRRDGANQRVHVVHADRARHGSRALGGWRGSEGETRGDAGTPEIRMHAPERFIVPIRPRSPRMPSKLVSSMFVILTLAFLAPARADAVIPRADRADVVRSQGRRGGPWLDRQA